MLIAADGTRPGDAEHAALWIAEAEGAAKILSATGSVLFELGDVPDIQAIASDAPRQRVWLYAPGILVAHHTSGRRLHHFALPDATLADGSQAHLAVDAGTGSLWLATGRDLRHLAPDGIVRWHRRLPADIDAIAFDARSGRLWVGHGNTLEAIDRSGASLSAELAAGSRDLDADRLGRLWRLTDRSVEFRDGDLRREVLLAGVDALASDGRGGAWLARGPELLHVGQNGDLRWRSEPFDGNPLLAILAAEPGAGMVWATDGRDVAKVDVDGVVALHLGFEPEIQIRDLAVEADRSRQELGRPTPPDAVLEITPFEALATDRIDRPWGHPSWATETWSGAGAAEQRDGWLRLSHWGPGSPSADRGVFHYVEAAGDLVASVDVAEPPGGSAGEAGLSVRADGRLGAARLTVAIVPGTDGHGFGLEIESVSEAGAAPRRTSVVSRIPSFPLRLAIWRRGGVLGAAFADSAAGGWTSVALPAVSGLEGDAAVLVGLTAAARDPLVDHAAAFDDFRLREKPVTSAPTPWAAPASCDAERPLDVVFLLDMSASMTSRLSGGQVRFDTALDTILALGDALDARIDGSRAALVTVSGLAEPALDRDHAVVTRVDLTENRQELAAAVAALRSASPEDFGTTPAGLGVDASRTLLEKRADLSHRPVIVWLTDGAANVSSEGTRHGDDTALVRLVESDGGFRAAADVAWSGRLGGRGAFAGAPLADAMRAADAITNRLPDAALHTVALGDPDDDARPDLLVYAAAVTGGTSIHGPDPTPLAGYLACGLRSAATARAEPAPEPHSKARGPSSTSVVGTVVQAGGAPAVGAEVSVLGHSGTTAVTDRDGAFTIADVDAGQGPLTVVATYHDGSETLIASSSGLAPNAGGETDAGILVLGPPCAARFARELFPGPAPGHPVAAVVFDDGTGPALYVAGQLTVSGDAATVARWDGARWSLVGDGFRFLDGPSSAVVRALAVFDDGTGPALYAAGRFTHSGFLRVNSIARWTGRAWVRVGCGLANEVDDLTVHDAGDGAELVAVGTFLYRAQTCVWDGIPLNIGVRGVARWNGTRWRSASNTEGPLGYHQVVSHQGQLIVASGSVLWAWDPSQVWSELYQAPSSIKLVEVLDLDDGGGARLYIAGQPGSGVQVWNGGQSWTSLDGAHRIFSLGRYDGPAGSSLVASGDFGDYGAPDFDTRRWDGQAWQPLAETPLSTVRTLLMYDGTLAAGDDRLVDDTWVPLSQGFDNDVEALAVYDDGRGPALYVGGRFTGFGGESVRGVARWDGSTMESVGGGVNGLVFALTAWDEDGNGPARPRLVVGGLFAEAGDDALPVNNLAAWDGQQWADLGQGVTTSPSGFARVDALLPFDDGGGQGPRLFVGGNFKQAGSQAVANLAAWDGRSWADVGGGVTGWVYALAAFGNELHVGGHFSCAGGTLPTCASGVTTTGIARWDGTAWHDVGGGVQSGLVFTLLPFDDGGERLIVGGNFLQAGGITAGRVAAWDGQNWAAIGYFDGSVQALAATDDLDGRRLWAGGGFGAVDGVPVAHVAVREDGTWAAAAGTNAEVQALAVYDDGEGPALYLGGSFTHDGGNATASGYLGRWRRPLTCEGDGVPPTIELTGPIDGSWTAADEVRFSGALSEPAELTLDGWPVPRAPDLSFDHGPLPLHPGPNRFNLAAEDADGETAGLSLTVHRDGDGPAIDFAVPADGATVHAARPALHLRFHDLGIGVEPASLALYRAGSPLGVACTSTVAGAVCVPDAPLGDGAVLLEATVADRLGNLSAPAAIQISVDTTAGSSTTVEGEVRLSDGSPVDGALVSIVGVPGANVASDAAGAFSIPDVDVSLDPLLSVIAHAPGLERAATAENLTPVVGGITPVGVLTLHPLCDLALDRGAFAAGGFDGPVYAVRSWDDGGGAGPMLYAGGDFTEAGGAPARNVARWDGVRWTALGDGVDQPVRSLVPFDDGNRERLYAGGYRQLADGVVAAWDGAAWTSLGTAEDEEEIYFGVEALTVFEGVLHAAGAATNAVGLTSGHVARWDGAAWSPLGTAFSEDVLALATFSGQLYAAGRFLEADGERVYGVARWDGAAWAPVDYGVGLAQDPILIRALRVTDLVAGTPELLIGGGFLHVDIGIELSDGVARWDGARWRPLDGTGGLDGGVYDLTGFDDGDGPALFAVGDSLAPDFDPPGEHVARWTGRLWEQVGGGFGIDLDAFGPGVHGFGGRAAAVHDDGDGTRLVVGGGFQRAGGEEARGIAAWDGQRWSPLGEAPTGPVRALARWNDGTGDALYAGGDFGRAGPAAGGIGRWDGQRWSGLGSGVDGTVAALVGHGGTLYAGGDFSIDVGSGAASHVAAWDGLRWSALASGLGGPVRALAAIGADLYAGGEFDDRGGQAHVARWDGTSWHPLNTGLAGPVRAFVAIGTDLYAGGDFAGGGLAHVARWDGAAWHPLGAGPGGSVHALAAFDDGADVTLFAGGDFPGNLGRWHAGAWDLVPGVDGPVRALSVYDDGDGAALFAVWENAGRARLGRWDGDTLAPVAAVDLDGPAAVALGLDGPDGWWLYLGGDFDGHLTRVGRPYHCPPDATPPTLAFETPLDGTVLDTRLPILELIYGDDDSGIDEASLEVRVDGTLVSPTGMACTFDAAGVSCALLEPLPIATVTLEASIADLAGNRSATEITVAVAPSDQEPPTLTWDVTGGGVILESRPGLPLSYDDAGGSGIEPSTLRLTLDGAPLDADCTHNAPAQQFVCTPTNDLPEGERVLHATIRDVVGNTSAPERLEIVIDIGIPTLSFVAPDDGERVGVRPILKLAYSDAGAGVNPSSLEVQVDGVPLVKVDGVPQPDDELGCNSNFETATCYVLVDLAEGVRTLTATVEDGIAQPSDPVSVDVTVDDSPPEITVSAPAIVGDTTATISGSLSEPALLRIDGIPVAVDPVARTFEHEVSLTEGENVVPLRATDALGLVGEAEVTITVDSSPPMLSFETPGDGEAISDFFGIELAYADLGTGVDPASFYIAVGPYTMSGCGNQGILVCDFDAPEPGLITIEIAVLPRSGEYTLSARIADRAGHQATAEVAILIDSTQPTLTITEPVHGGAADRLEPRITLSFEDPTSSGIATGIDPASLELRADGAALPADCDFGETSAVCRSLVSFDPDQTITVEATIADRAGLRSQPAQSTFTIDLGNDHTAPILTLDPLPNLTNEARLRMSGMVSELVVLTLNGAPVTLTPTLGFSEDLLLDDGPNTLTWVATDFADPKPHVTEVSAVVVLDSAPPAGFVGTPGISGPVDGVVTVDGTVADSADAAAVTVVHALTGDVATVGPDPDGTFVLGLPALEGDALVAYVRDEAGNPGAQVALSVPGAFAVPDDPSALAPALDPSVAPDLCTQVAFFYQGPEAVQRGVVPGAIDCRRIAVLSGSAVDLSGAPVTGARVRIAGRPELGATRTRADGRWDLVADGGGWLTVELHQPGHAPTAQRISIGAHERRGLPDATLAALDAPAPPLDPVLGGAARGSVVTDEIGTRRTTVLLPSGLAARAELPGGASQALDQLSVRATELSVGAHGRGAVPGVLPPGVGPVYTVDLTVEEAHGLSATGVRFDRPLPVYVENVLGLPVGMRLPWAAYDPGRGVWLAEADGRVVSIIAIDSGVASIDGDGDSVGDDAAALDALGITDEERQRLGSLYQAGDELLRLAVDHFSTFVLTLPSAPDGADGALLPDLPSPATLDDLKLDRPSLTFGGALIEAENQIAGYALGVFGTPWSLHYSSDRVPGRTAPYVLRVPLAVAELPAGLQGIDLSIDVAGQHVARSFAPPIADPSFTWTWNGLDGFGRPVPGTALATSRLRYRYDGELQDPGEDTDDSTFGDPGDPDADPVDVPSREAPATERTEETRMGAFDARAAFGFGGWSLSSYHYFDREAGVIHFGDGRRRTLEGDDAVDVLYRVAGSASGEPGAHGDGGPAVDAALAFPEGVSVTRDGGLLIADTGNCRVRKVGADGIIHTVAGLSDGCDEGPAPTSVADGVAATASPLRFPSKALEGPDGSIYIADQGHFRIRRVDPEGIIHTFAGIGERGYTGEGQPATTARIGYIQDLALGPDGSLYLSQVTYAPGDPPDGINAIRRITPDGRIEKFVGAPVPPINVPAPIPREEFYMRWPTGIDVLPDGTVYFIDRSTLVEVRPDGSTSWRNEGCYPTANGSGFRGDGAPVSEACFFLPYHLTAAPDGSLFIADRLNWRIRRVGSDGVVNTVVGGGGPVNEDGVPATSFNLFEPMGVDIDPSNRILYFSARGLHSVWRNGLPAAVAGADALIPSEDGRLVYLFDAQGRHLETRSGLTGAVLLRFEHQESDDGLDDPEAPPSERLVKIVDAVGNETSIERNPDGTAEAIVGPFGERTELAYETASHAEGYLESVTRVLSGANETVALAYHDAADREGLLVAVTDPKLQTYEIDYDDLGRLETVIDPADGGVTLGFTETGRGHDVSRSTAMGRTTRFALDRTSTEDTVQTFTREIPAGPNLVSTFTREDDGTLRAETADETRFHAERRPDERLGPLVLRPETVTITPPDETLERVTTVAPPVVTLADPGDPTSVLSLVAATSINGREWQSAYQRDVGAESGTVTLTTPEGRQTTVEVDVLHRPIRAEAPGLAPVVYEYDDRGRLERIIQGPDTGIARIWQLTYYPDVGAANERGRLASVRDPLDQVTRYRYDEVGRVVEIELHDQRIVSMDHDANGNVTHITPPSRPPHVFGHDAVDHVTVYRPPEPAPEPIQPPNAESSEAEKGNDRGPEEQR